MALATPFGPGSEGSSPGKIFELWVPSATAPGASALTERGCGFWPELVLVLVGDPTKIGKEHPSKLCIKLDEQFDALF